MQEYQNAWKYCSGVGIFTVTQLHQAGIDIPASGTIRYRWSRSSAALPSCYK
jgi:hypothetical protein